MTDKKMAIVVIILSTILMQIHSIDYWLEAAGPSGWAWSIALEAAMLWLWYQKRLLPVRILAALILISGPWYTLTSPAIESLQEKTEIREQILSEESKVNQLTASIARYEENSAERIGWSGRIDRTQTRLDLARESLQVKRDDATSLGVEWRLYMVAGMQAAVLLIVMITQLMAVAGLRDITEPVSKELKDVSKLQPASKLLQQSGFRLSEYDRAVAAVATVLKAKLEEFGNVQSALATHFGFRPADVSMVFNHIERRAAKKETISHSALKRMVVKLGIEKGEYQGM